jgi:hypothetical protein
MNTRVTWIKGNTLGSPILQIENIIYPFTEEFGWCGLLWKWFANDKIDDEEKYLEVASMTEAVTGGFFSSLVDFVGG